MLPNHMGSSNLENVRLSYIDASDDDEDTNNDDLLPERQCFTTTTNVGILSSDKCANRSVINGISTKITIPPVNETLIARRPSAIYLKPLLTINLDRDQTDGCFGTREELEHDFGKGINVKFQDIIYRVRRGFSWDRCKCRVILIIVIFNRIF